ncbi:MAG: M50 family metallopeptidase [Verrucomicrobia bacterium]|nr:M50 family metallopeptidase [Verrucomicrobiota bacterium]
MQFTFLRIPVTIHPSFWIFMLLVVLQGGYGASETTILAFIFFFSLLFHEYGHGLTALAMGKAPEIHLVAFGGYTTFRNLRMTNKEHFIITLNGPLFSAILIGLAYYLLKFSSGFSREFCFFLYLTMKLNIFWLIVNLIPLEPLDGGQLLRSILTKYLGEARGSKITLVIGLISASVGSAYFLATGSYFFGTLFLFHGIQNFQIVQRNATRDRPADFTLYNNAMEDLKEERIEQAKSTLKKLMKAKDPFIQISATEGMAAALTRQGAKKEAYHLLLRADHGRLKRGKILLCMLAFEEKNYQIIDAYSREIYEINPTFETALLISKACAALKKPEDSGGWLHTASLFDNAPKEGLKELLNQPIYDPIRDDERFQTQVQDLLHEPSLK